MMVNHFYLLYINGDGDYDGHRPFSITGLRNCPMDRPLGSTLRNNSWITAPFQFLILQQGNARLKISNLLKKKIRPLVIAWYSLLQSSGQCGSSFSRTCATRLFRRFSGKLFVGTMSLFIFLKLHNSYQSCISSLAAIVDKPPSWRSMSATVIPAFPHWPNSGQCWEIL